MPAIYESYAPIYRRMEQGAWSEQLVDLTLSWLASRGLVGGRVVDWGCGDGAAAVRLAGAGWSVTGIDQSSAMLALAAERATAAGVAIRWLQGDLRHGVCVAGAQLATALYDTLNYITSLDELMTSWRSLAASVEPGGYVVADLNTPYEYASSWTGEYCVTADTEDLLVLNRLRYNARSGMARGRVLWFSREPEGELWRRGTELHLQRAHTDEELCAAIAAAGLQLVERRTPQGLEPTASATRIVYLARKPVVNPGAMAQG